MKPENRKPWITAVFAATVGCAAIGAAVTWAGSGTATAASPAAAPGPLAQEVAAAYGVADWHRVDRVDFTFDATLPDGRTFNRSWSWKPEGAGGVVTLDPGGDDELTFNAHDDPAEGTALFTAKRNFVNDSYWLAFPLQLAWSNPTVTEAEPEAMPIAGGDPVRKLTAAWPAEGGFTPGDAYDLYLGPDGRIAEWVFRPGGGDEGRPATWENEQTAAGVTLATEHRGPDGNGFTLGFPQLKVWADGAAEPTVLRGE